MEEASMQDLFSKASEIGDACISAQFYNGNFVIICKNKQDHKDVPEGCKYFAISPNQRCSMNKTYDILKQFLEAPHIATIECKEPVEINWTDLEKHLRELTADEIKKMRQDAKQPHDKGKAHLGTNPILTAIWTFRVDVKEFEELQRKTFKRNPIVRCEHSSRPRT